MKYSSFNIQNFKGIKSIDINLDRVPTSPVFALVGLNESGKTTILEAIHWLYDDSRILDEELIPKSKLTNFNGNVQVSATLNLSDEETEKVKQFLWKKCGKFVATEPISKVTISRVYKYKNSVLTEKGNMAWEIPLRGKKYTAKNVLDRGPGDTYWDKLHKFLKENFFPPIIYYEDFLFEFPEKIYLEAKEGQALSQIDIRYRAVIQDVLMSIDKYLRIDTHLVNRFKSGTKKPLEATLNSLSSTVTKEVFQIWRDLLKFESDSKMEISFGQTLYDDPKGFYIEVSVKEEDQNFLIRERSKGFQWFFAFFLFTIFRAYRYKQQVNSLFLLDEPASNLHSTAQGKLLEVFEDIPNKQTIIYTTHSHHMINPRWLAGTYVIKNEALDYSEIDVSYSSHLTEINATPYFQFAQENPGETDYFQPILDRLDYQPSRLELIPELVIMEGKNDYYTFKYILEHRYAKSKKCKNITSGFGKDTLDTLISLQIGWGKNFLVMLDDDKGGRSTYKRLRDKFGTVLEGKIYRLHHADDRFKGNSLEGVFAKRDQKKMIKSVYADEDEYDKVKFNIAIQQNYYTKKKIDLSEYTIDRFQSLFDFLDANL